MSDHGVNSPEPSGRVPMCDAHAAPRSSVRTETIDWYAEGESRIVRVSDVEVHVRFVGRKGRRGRIVISAPAGARFVAK
jgi:hypothetical protein